MAKAAEVNIKRELPARQHLVPSNGNNPSVDDDECDSYHEPRVGNAPTHPHPEVGTAQRKPIKKQQGTEDAKVRSRNTVKEQKVPAGGHR